MVFQFRHGFSHHSTSINIKVKDSSATDTIPPLRKAPECPRKYVPSDCVRPALDFPWLPVRSSLERGLMTERALRWNPASLLNVPVPSYFDPHPFPFHQFLTPGR